MQSILPNSNRTTRSGAHQIPHLARQTHRTRAEGNLTPEGHNALRSKLNAATLCNREISHHKREHQWHYEEIRAVRTIHQRELKDRN